MSSPHSKLTPCSQLYVSLNVQNTPLKSVLKELTKQTGRRFILDDPHFNKIPITLKSHAQPFLSVLMQIMIKTELDFQFQSNFIQIYQSGMPYQNFTTTGPAVIGYVVNSQLSVGEPQSTSQPIKNPKINEGIGFAINIYVDPLEYQSIKAEFTLIEKSGRTDTVAYSQPADMPNGFHIYARVYPIQAPNHYRRYKGILKIKRPGLARFLPAKKYNYAFPIATTPIITNSRISSR
ncbi:hypothetical protein JD969_04990 [Planctomycetota bacterium]|nr:hypothetical protein JD969_04990 [Planctomycetota bacterium]